MPDSRLINWNEKDQAAIIAETELFVAEILRRNHPIDTFIDPSFTHLNKRNARLYGIKFPNSEKMTRVQIERGGRHGGILGPGQYHDGNRQWSRYATRAPWCLVVGKHFRRPSAGTSP